VILFRLSSFNSNSWPPHVLCHFSLREVIDTACLVTVLQIFTYPPMCDSLKEKLL
jgi:hypothetical protein